jgi:acyl-[acyl-carrier-protein]-phospholipid O-acyltransferase / long-chain-fatty-acid--[acyl-carrier-protein] ligase
LPGLGSGHTLRSMESRERAPGMSGESGIGERVVRSALRFLAQLLFRVKVRGTEQSLRHDRTLIVANHESFLDGLLLAVFLPVDAVFVVHTSVARHPVLGRLLRFVPHLAVDSTSPLAMKQVYRLVESGTPVVIFPEGRITVTGALMKVYDGAAFVAAKSGATIVPVRIEGAGRSYFSRLSGVYPRRLFPRITLTVLPPRQIPMPALPSAKQRRRRAGELMRRILMDALVASRPEHTLYQAFLAARRTFGSGYRLVEDARQQEETYCSLLRMTLALQRLLGRHTAAGETVGVLLPNAAATLSLVLGLSAGRRVPAMLNYSAGAEAMRAACRAACVKTVVASRAFVEKARLGSQVAALVAEGTVNVVWLEDRRGELTLGDRLWILWHLRLPALAEIRQQPDDAACVLFTSGSEGRPKGVVHSHSSLLANVAQVRAVADFTPLDKFMVALPLFHSFGLTCGALLPLVSGCRVFLYPSPLHYRVIPEVVYDRNCTVLFGTATFLANYGKHAHPYDFGRMRYVVSGAEKLADDVRALWLDKFGIRILEGYGVTECAPVIAVNVPMAYRTGTVGQLLPGMQYEIEPVPGIEAGGALHVRGPNVMKGYLLHDQPGVIQPPRSIGDGWYATGDIVLMDADDFVTIRGRVKRFAKIAGEMVSLEVVEQIAARAAPSFLHAASTRPDVAKGEAIVLFTTSPDICREQLSAAAREIGASELAVARVVRQVAQIPLLSTGKTDYVRVKQWAETGEVA